MPAFFRLVTSVFLAVVLLGITTAVADAIRKGTTTNDLLKTVMMIGEPVEGGIAISTTTNVWKPRCLLTTAHDLGAPANLTLYQGQNEPFDKFQKAAKVKKYPGFNSPNTDLAVVWVEHITGTGRLQEPADYSPLPYGAAALLAATDEISMMGYGSNKDEAPTGGKVKRKGVAKIDAAVSGPVQSPAYDGGWYKIVPTAADQLVCEGDSGGPLFKKDDYTRVHGVAVGGTPGKTCETDTQSYYTALDMASRPGQLSNQAWVDRATTEICGKKGVIAPAEHGKVSAVLYNERYTYSDDETINGVMLDCRTTGGDCVEMVHAGEYLIIGASADAGWQFDHWMGTNCPCTSDTTGVCTMEYDDMGLYNATTSADESTCSPVFVATGGGGPSPPP